MHRTITVAVPTAATDAFPEGLAASDDVVGLSASRGASVKPAGDVVTVHVLNQGAGRVLRLVGEAHRHGPVVAVKQALVHTRKPLV